LRDEHDGVRAGVGPARPFPLQNQTYISGANSHRFTPFRPLVMLNRRVDSRDCSEVAKYCFFR